MEISQASIEKSDAGTRFKLTEDILKLLQVRDKNADMTKDWILFLSTSRFCKLRPGEVYLAFQMAMSRELLDSKGDEINILPELSNNTTSKVLTAYMKWKREHSDYQIAKTKLKNTREEMTEDQRAAIRLEFLQSVYDELKESGFSSSAWLLFDDVEKHLNVPDDLKKSMYADEYKKYMTELKADIDNNGRKPHHVQIYNDTVKASQSGKFNPVVKNRCKSIVVSDFLKNYISDFVTFTNAIAR